MAAGGSNGGVFEGDTLDFVEHTSLHVCIISLVKLSVMDHRGR